ncbi:hypothetical protein Asp14428_44060 [Actinoplanes sp. NBRC 14428]|nr:hypothetical protein Asp14428_44060 [Actinoplanes sp. NBRC 14428]
MNDTVTTALRRLRDADPATGQPDPHEPSARAMLDRVLHAPDAPVPARPRQTRRRLVLAAAAVAAAVSASGLVIVQPWSQGSRAVAYTVERQGDGSVRVSVKEDQIDDLERLNADLARANARTVFIREQVGCREKLRRHPDFVTQREPVPVGNGESVLNGIIVFPDPMNRELPFWVIAPDRIPPGATLVIGFEELFPVPDPENPNPPHERGGLGWRQDVVTEVPSCLALPKPKIKGDN